MSMPTPALAQNLSASVDTEKPDLIITAIKPYHYEWLDEYEEDTPPLWFNLENEVDVIVENKGDVESGEFYVCLYAKAEDDDEYKSIDKLPVPSLGSAESSEPLHFEWTPIGDDCLKDCTFTDTSKEYELKAVADCDFAINESNEKNNEKIEEEVTACYNGYMADHPLKNVAHGTLHGGLIFTTGDGEYGGLYSNGASIDTNYEITLPEGATVKLARLNVYYTWCKPEHTCPEMEVSIDGNILLLDASYNDIKCWGSWIFAWGNYVYDITDYIQGSGTYTVTVKSVCTQCKSFCIAAPSIVLVYEDKNAPMVEYWINEGADVLIGGRRGDGGYLSLEECKNTATFDGEHLDLEVEKATLAVVSPWGDDKPDDVLYFNGEKMGEGVYCGYHDSCEKEEEGISMITYTAGAIRTLPAEPVSAGKSFTVVINAAYDSDSAQVIETLPEGFVYEKSTLNQESVEVGDNTVKFKLQGEHSFNYTVRAPESEDTYTFSGTLIVEGDEYEVYGAKEIMVEEDGDDDDEKKEEGRSGSPNITAWNPIDAVVNNTEGESRTFNITVNQTVDISWQINGTEVQTNESVTEATYTNASAVSGIWNVSVITTPTPAVNITTTPTPTAAPISTSTPTLAITPTSTPTPAEEKKQPGAEETKAPGFELAMSSFILIAVAYLLRKRRKL
jgi:hypothetical protein